MCFGAGPQPAPLYPTVGAAHDDDSQPDPIVAISCSRSFAEAFRDRITTFSRALWAAFCVAGDSPRVSPVDVISGTAPTCFPSSEVLLPPLDPRRTAFVS